ncbi:MAG: efflux RND transporter periplasmic adaptor subunit [Candidatus Eremiobacteraeota bacterium]|nr:efflux RND transporter periplasmic adaptor subunit [Candidatus Eremiobacteraeota bacterium]
MRLRFQRELSPALQLAIVAAAGSLLAFFLVPFLLARGQSAPQRPAPPPSSTSFRPTDEQWSSLVLEPVRTMAYAPANQADGKIATDDDLTTAVFSPYSGRITRVFVRVGDAVRKGEPLLAVQASEYVQGQNDLAAAAATLRTAREQLRQAERTAARQQALLKINGAALKDVEQSRVDLATARSTVASDEVALAAVRNRLRILGKSDEQIRALERGADPAKMSPDAIVSAPIGGTVLQRQVGVGQNVQSVESGGSTALLTIADLSTVWLVASVREVDAPKMRLGEHAAVRLLAYPNRTFDATIGYIAGTLDPNTHRLAVRADVPNPDGALKPEMFATFSIATGGERTTLGVPAEAVVYEGDKARVWVAGANKSLALRYVRVGATADGVVEVRSGLRAGERVVTSGSLFIDRAAKGT